MVASEQVAQGVLVGLGHGAEEAGEDSLAIRGLGEHLGHEFGDVVLTRRHRDVAVRADAAVAGDETLLLQPGENGVDRRQSEIPISEGVARSAALSPSSWTQMASMTPRSSSPSVPTIPLSFEKSIRLVRSFYLYAMSNSM